MAITKLTEQAREESTFPIVVAFTDDAGNPVTPNTVTWTLMDLNGTVINAREDVSETPDTSITIVLKGDDLAVSDGDIVDRAVTVKATYNSTLGNNLPLNEEVRFSILNLLDVP